MTYMPIRNKFPIQIMPEVSNNEYTHDLQMYMFPPSGYINLEELQQLCIDRLRVLKLVQQVSIQNYQKSPKDCISILTKEMEKNDLHDFAKLVNAPGCMSQEKTVQCLRRNDHISHFILRSAFSFEYAKQEWFLKQEVKLFKWRFSSLDKEAVNTFCSNNGINYVAISEEEKQKIKKELESSYCDIENIEDMKFYKVYFTNVLKLVSKKKIFLKGGIAYIPENEISSLIVPKFKKLLNEGFAVARQVASNLYGDERMTTIFGVLPNSIRTEYFKYNKYRQVHLDDLDELSQTSYPLCMRLLHKALTTNHHLTNGGRFQYCLFLKGIGLNLKDASQFWKNEFTQKVNVITFTKEYAYQLRHLYGEEGKRANYEPYPCFKIFKFKIGLRDNHGCPFKCTSAVILKKILLECGLNQTDIKSVVELAKERLYLEACKKYYEATHNCSIENTFDHPNIYFNYSREVFENSVENSENSEEETAQ